MKTTLAASLVLAVLPMSALAQGEPAAAPAPAGTGCYVEVAKLMADPPSGIGDLGTAIRELDTKLRPQVEEVNALKAEIARLEARQTEGQGSQAGGGEEGGFGDDPPRPATPAASDPTAERLAEAQTDLEAKQSQLKLDYAEQQRVLVGPVQTRVSERAQVFAAAQGCVELKMARAPDLAGLTSAGSRNVTGEFITWYLANPSS